MKLCDFGVSGELIGSQAGTFTGTAYYMAVRALFFLLPSIRLPNHFYFFFSEAGTHGWAILHHSGGRVVHWPVAIRARPKPLPFSQRPTSDRTDDVYFRVRGSGLFISFFYT